MTEMRIGLNFSPTDKNTLLKDYKKQIKESCKSMEYLTF